MMIENVLDAEQLKRQRDQEDIVRRIAALDHMKAMSHVDPRRIQKLPEQRRDVLPQIAKHGVSLRRHRVSVDVDPFNHLMSLCKAFSSRTQYRHVISVSLKRASFFPNTWIERNCLVFDNYEGFSFHKRDLVETTMLE